MVTEESETCNVASFEEGGRGQEPRNALEAGKGKEKDSPQSFQKGHSPADTLILVQ